MLQISKGECQFLFDLLHEIQEGKGYIYDVPREVEEGIEILDEILKREGDE